jgi:hypothetical protein
MSSDLFLFQENIDVPISLYGSVAKKNYEIIYYDINKALIWTVFIAKSMHQ